MILGGFTAGLPYRLTLTSNSISRYQPFSRSVFSYKPCNSASRFTLSATTKTSFVSLIRLFRSSATNSSWTSFKSNVNLNQRQQCSLSHKLRNEFLNLFSIQKSGRKTVFNHSSPFNVNSNIAQDALVFSHNNDKFFRLLSLFGFFNMLMWGYLTTSVWNLKSGPVIKKDTSDLPWWQTLLYAEGRYKNGISFLFIAIGASLFFLTIAYPSRAVRQLWLLKGGREVEIQSHAWFGKTSTLRTPLEHISCYNSRNTSQRLISFKIKDRPFFFVLDKQGEFHNPKLFDFVIALKRNF